MAHGLQKHGVWKKINTTTVSPRSAQSLTWINLFTGKNRPQQDSVTERDTRISAHLNVKISWKKKKKNMSVASLSQRESSFETVTCICRRHDLFGTAGRKPPGACTCKTPRCLRLFRCLPSKYWLELWTTQSLPATRKGENMTLIQPLFFYLQTCRCYWSLSKMSWDNGGFWAFKL